MILIDKQGHMVSDKSEQELHEFAKQLGLKRAWFQNCGRHPHYDLTTESIRQRAKLRGANTVTTKELVFKAWWSKMNVCAICDKKWLLPLRNHSWYCDEYQTVLKYDMTREEPIKYRECKK
jgi:hypothetical protein